LVGPIISFCDNVPTNSKDDIQAILSIMVVKPAELAIPIINLEPIRSGIPDQALDTGKEVYEAFRGVGFAYIKNHGLPQQLLDQAFEWVGSHPVNP